MRRIVMFLCSVVSFGVAAFCFGPRVALDETIRSDEIPENMDSWLAEKEARFSDLVKGSEKRIVWANGQGQKTKRVLVYLHGFSASRQETAPLMDNLAGELGANLFETRLTGHGRSANAMTEASVNAWLNDASEALAVAEMLGDEVIVVGVSTGGTLAWWLAAYARERVDKLVLISPNFRPRAAGSGLLAGPWGEQLASLLMGDERCFEPRNEQQTKYWTECYPSKALLPMVGLLKLVESIPARDISQPVLAIYSPEDTVVDSQYSVSRLEALKPEQLTSFVVLDSDDPKQHVLAGDILSPKTTAAVADSIKNFVEQGQAM